MDADIKGALRNLNDSWKAFEHNGRPLSKKQVEGILKYGIFKGYKSTSEFADGEIDGLLFPKSNPSHSK